MIADRIEIAAAFVRVFVHEDLRLKVRLIGSLGAVLRASRPVPAGFRLRRCRWSCLGCRGALTAFSFPAFAVVSPLWPCVQPMGRIRPEDRRV